MDGLVAWVISNKQWLFSGVGITLIALMGRVIFKGMQTSSTQENRSGDNSINLQASRDININSGSKNDDVE